MTEETEVNGAGEGEEEREFARRPMSSILGAPLSWVALFGALTGVGSLIPVLMYSGGGGYASLSQIVLFPVTGMLLGPWAGFVAGLIGGLIGLFVAPGAFPMGPLDVVLSGAIPALVSGLLARRWRWVMLVWWVLSLALVVVFPYRWPGQTQGFAPPPEPAYLLSYWYILLGFVAWLVWAFTPVGRWVHRGRPVTLQSAGFLWAPWVAITAHRPIWQQPYAYVLKWPPEMTITDNHAAFLLYVIAVVVQGLAAFALFRALWRTGLRRVPGSLLDETAVGMTNDQ
ncbi:MAG: hypothetical protein ISS49_04270 [Anaerolineae bacterium]|nr:hypothetical protein [Anaerolineae bacterium]